MAQPSGPLDPPPEPGPGWRDRLVGLGAVEGIAVGTAIALPLTPSKTGSTWSPAHLFWPDPSYLQKVLATFVMANVLLLGLGLVAWLVSKRSTSTR